MLLAAPGLALAHDGHGNSMMHALLHLLEESPLFLSLAGLGLMLLIAFLYRKFSSLSAKRKP
jgi:hypothetical protein